MALRFRTRLSLTISALLFLTVAALSLVTIGVHIYDLSSIGYDRGRDLTVLANRNIDFGVNVPPAIMGVVDEQMIVQALLVSELTALAERPGAASPQDIQAALDRVIERSRAHTGEALVDSFRVLDENGNPIVSSGSGPLTQFGPDIVSEGGRYADLLEPGAEPVVTEMPTQLHPGSQFKYVGVSGADEPRVVQVGASQDVLDSIRKQFNLDDLLDRFMLPNHFNRVAVVDPEGRVLAAVDKDGEHGREIVTKAMVRASQDYIAQGKTNPGFIQSGRTLWVITSLGGDDDARKLALFIEYELADDMQFVGSRVSLVLTVGGIMILVGILVGMFLSSSLAKPIVALSKGAREFGQGNLSYRIYFKRKDEFQGLAQAFNTMAISLQEHMHELERETSNRERLESEFRIAAEMQRALLPDHPPEIPGLELAGWSQPSREVGGDFYDFFDTVNGCIGIALGDATGKGVSAALLTTECAGILRTLAHEHDDCAELLRRTNEALHSRVGQTHRFVTLYLIVFDPATGRLRYASAGHPSPIVLPGDGSPARWLDEDLTGYPLGIRTGSEYVCAELQLNPGDTVIVYSDGLTDARNAADELYGEDRVLASVARCTDESPETILVRAREEAATHMNGREPVDDLTLVGIRYTAETESGSS